MKKLLLPIAFLIAMMSFSSCVKSAEENNEEQNDTQTTEQEQPASDSEVTEEPTEEPTEETSEETTEPPAEQEESKAEQILSEMSLHEKVCQMFISSPDDFYGTPGVTYVDDWFTGCYDAYPIGGFLMFETNLIDSDQTGTLLHDMQTLADSYGTGLFLGVDEEGGSVSRLYNTLGTDYISAMSNFGELNDYDSAYWVGETIGANLAKFGFNVDFAPVADVNINEANELGDRIFSSDPKIVADMSSAVIEGLHSQMICSTLKHFPGLGAGDGNTHYGSVYIDRSLDELKETEFTAFKGGIEAGSEFVLGADIDLSEYSCGEGWEIIGKQSNQAFQGTFDGNGYAISNLYIYRDSEGESNSPIQHINLGSGSVSGEGGGRLPGISIGGSGSGSGSGSGLGNDDIENIFTTKAVGLFGYVENGTIKNLSLFDCDVILTENADENGSAGLIAGNIFGTSITNCTAFGSVSAQNETGDAGLIVGNNHSVSLHFAPQQSYISNCHTSGSVFSASCAGGIIGNVQDVNIDNCHSEADVKASRVFSDDSDNFEFAAAGGLVGNGKCIITNSSSSGKISSNNMTGGLIGFSESGDSEEYIGISNSVFTGTVSSSYEGQYSGVGTIVGCLDGYELWELQEDECDFYYGITGAYDSVISNSANVIGYNGGSIITSSAIDTSSQLQVGVDSTDSSSIKFTTNISLASVNALRLGGMEGAKSLENIDSFISKLSEAQTKLGAIENRLTSTIESIGVNIENLTSSRSTLKDADVAKESSQMLKNQILQQASATLLATANQTPALALRLLDGIQ